MKILDNKAGNLAGHGGVAGVDLADRLQKPGWRSALEQISVRPGPQRFVKLLLVVVYREHQYLHCRNEALQFRDAINARSARQIDVKQNNVGAIGWDLAQGFRGVAIGPHAAEPFAAVNQGAEALANPVIILHDRNSNAINSDHNKNAFTDTNLNERAAFEHRQYE